MVDTIGYVFGIVLAAGSGIANNIGTVLQKKVVNDLPGQERFFRRLFTNKLWLIGLILQRVLGAVFFVVAQILIGPVLIPGIMAFGLVFLAIGAARIVGEKLGRAELIGIAFMIASIAMLGYSGLSVKITVDYTQPDLMLRIVIFTAVGFGSALVCFSARQGNRYRGILYAIGSGCLIAVTNYWISPLVGVIVKVFDHTAVPLEWIVFLAASAILVINSIFGITTLQTAFQTGRASTLVPIQQCPITLAPLAVFFYIYMNIAQVPTTMQSFLMIGGTVFVIASSFLLGRRQAQVEKIK